jgi:hypothetical protein
MKIVGYKAETMRTRYNAIDEEDLTQAEKTLNTYLQRNTLGTLGGTDQPAHQAKWLKMLTAPVAQLDRAAVS